MGKYEGHTPGPWTDGICTFGPDGKPIMVCTEDAVKYGEGDKEARANAILIADAPMLAERVEELEQLLSTKRGTIENYYETTKKLAEQNEKMLAMLKRAHEHLDYTGYGDSWERECAKEDGIIDELPALIAEIEGK